MKSPRRKGKGGKDKSLGAIEKDYVFPIPKYHAPEPRGTLEGEEPLEQKREPSDPKNEYLIKRVVGKTFSSTGNILYTVRWVGYTRKSDTKETLNLADPDPRLVQAAEKFEKLFSKVEVEPAWRVRAIAAHIPLPHTRILCPLDPTVAKADMVFWPATALCPFNIKERFPKWGEGDDVKQQVWIYFFKKNIVTPFTFTEAKKTCISPPTNGEYLDLCNRNLLNIKCRKLKNEYRAALKLSLHAMHPSFISGILSGPDTAEEAIQLRQKRPLNSDVHMDLFARSGPSKCTRRCKWNFDFIKPEFVPTLVERLLDLCQYISHPQRGVLADLLSQQPHHSELLAALNLRRRKEMWAETCLHLMESAINNENSELHEDLSKMLGDATDHSTRLTPEQALQWQRRLMGRMHSSRQLTQNSIPYNPHYATVEPTRKRASPVEDAEDQPKRKKKRARIDETQSA